MNALYQTAIIKEGDSAIYMCDTIIYKGEPYIVLGWHEAQTGEPVMPSRIVRLGALKHQECSGKKGYRYLVNNPLPEALVRGGNVPEELANAVIDSPEVSIQIGNS